MRDLLNRLWNCKLDNYNQCKHPTSQKIVDFIKDKYIKLNINIEKGYYKIKNMDIPLQRRITNSLLSELGYKIS